MAQDYQLHHYKDEVITVVNGSGEFVIDGCLMKLSYGDTICIRRGQKHTMRAIEDLQMICVQIGEEMWRCMSGVGKHGACAVFRRNLL